MTGGITGAIRLVGRAGGRPLLRSSPLPWKLGGLAVVILIWQLLGPLNPIILSYPTEILASAYQLIFQDSRLVEAFAVTFQALAVGMVFASVGGVLLGFVMGRVPVVEVLLKPYVMAFYATPRIALIPLLILWFGIDFQMRVVVVVLSALFPIAINAYQGARFIDPDYDETATSFVANRWQTLRTVIFPATLPFVFTGLRVGLIRGLVGVIVAEMTAAVTGTGRLLLQLGSFFQTGRLLVPVLLLGVIGIFLLWLLDAVQRRVAPWTATKAGG
jgi:ABC-type nitrate/sulfonate/bicarbonate transport system permease component